MNAATARLLVEAKWVNCVTKNCIGKAEAEKGAREREREKKQEQMNYCLPAHTLTHSHTHHGTPVRQSNLLTSITLSHTHLAALLVRLLAEAIATIYANGADGGITLGQVTPTAAAHIADH